MIYVNYFRNQNIEKYNKHVLDTWIKTTIVFNLYTSICIMKVQNNNFIFKNKKLLPTLYK